MARVAYGQWIASSFAVLALDIAGVACDPKSKFAGGCLMTDLIVSEHQIVERVLAMELVRVTERAAVSCARWRGRGDEKAAD